MTRVKFGDVIREVKVNIDRATDNHEYYIAGEHMESENIHISQRGRFEGSDVGPAFIRLFKPGQILYGSRRTYLKKVAVADFEGITSNTTFVLESKDENVLLQGLIPYIMLTDDFTDYSIGKSKGSTNPYILFSDLAEYEFELPDIFRQKFLLALLDACDSTKEAYKAQIKATDDLVKSQFIEMFGTAQHNEKGWPLMSMKDAAIRISDGPFGSNLKSEHYRHEGVRVIRLQNICDGYFLDDDKAYVGWDHYEKIKKYTCHAGDIVIGTLGEPNLRACLIPDNIEIAINKADCVHYIPRPELLDKRFVCAFINSPATLEMAIGDAHGNTRQRISSGQLAKLPIIIPPLKLQLEYTAFAEQSDKSKFILQIAIYRDVWNSPA